ncbi:hypothetical protein OHA72_46110 [Dactylosporangium sp. NBC_01737]|uniref:hypothetical protein n=1 Tax=Dactylosporangium sp. NBC_01737 TaxID=2975959 RepID=UPI002E15CD3A|nr:hypothetical protein OHA72_46110 [Dactylosporangium sp. NBC_01737]
MAERESDADAMALAAIGLGGLWVHEYRKPALAILMESRQRRAMAVVDAGSTLALRIRARLAGETDYRSGGHAAILAIVEEARRSGDPVAFAETANLAHHCVLGPGHGALRRRLADELIAASFQTERPSDLLMGMLWRTVDLFLDADPHAERSLEELRGLLGEQKHLAVDYVVRSIKVMLALRAGRFAAAELAAADAAERGRAAGDADATGWYGGQLVSIRWFQGRIAELLPMLRDLAFSPTLSEADDSHIGALAVAAAAAGEHREAAGALARLAGTDLTRVARSSSWLVAMYGVVEAANLLGDQAVSSLAYDILEPHRALPMMASIGVTCFGSVEHALGVASLTIGETDRAIEHLRSAVRGNLRIGHLPAATLSRWRLASALLRRRQGDDTVGATREIEIAEKDAAAFGMTLPAAGPATGVVRPSVAAAQRKKVVADVHRHGQQWEVAVTGRSAVVPHSVGMVYLATLVGNPGHEIPAVELAMGVQAPDAAGDKRVVISEQPVLDDAAKRAYKQRLSELDSEIQEFEVRHDIGRVEQLRLERTWLVREITAAAGLRGNVRSFVTNDERARLSVSRAIWRALDRICNVDAEIGERLRRSIKTGLKCSYHPF